MTRIYLYLLLLISGGIYSFGVTGPLVFDDGANLEPLLNIREGLVPWYAAILSNVSGSIGRPVSMFSFLIDYWMFGFNSIAFKIHNVILHLIVGGTLFVFIRKLIANTPYKKHRNNIALAVTCCWALSPLFVSTVLYAVQRMAMLSTLFTLLTLLAYLSFRQGLEKGRVCKKAIVCFFASAFLGLGSKENAALLPLFIFVLEAFFCRPILNPWGEWWRKRMVFIVAVFPMILGILLVTFRSNHFFAYEIRSFTLAERLFTETRVMWSYVGSLLVPQSSHFGLFHDDIQISKNLVTPLTTLAACLGWIIVVVGILYFRRFNKLRPVAGGIAFFLVGHAMESSIFALEIYFEHRNYLPGMGVYLSVVLMAVWLLEKEVITLTSAKVILASYAVVLAIALSQRVMIWRHYETLVYSSFKYHPNSPRAIVEAASQDAQKGIFDGAVQKLNYAKENKLAPLLGVNLQLIWTYCLGNRSGLEDEVYEMFEGINIDNSPYTQMSLGQLNDLYAQRHCDKVPYKQSVEMLSARLRDFYSSGEYKGWGSKQLDGLSGLQMRVIEALNLIGRTDKSVELFHAIDRAGQGGFGMELLSAVAMIDVNRLDEARTLIRNLKQDQSMAARMESSRLAAVEAMYLARLEIGKNGG